ncbi:AAA family ATPase [Dactylosporangium sp. McL0621]|uniref:ATP-binding protein n=1 Tax=Dactylosporangium sp. McL0621 TaxID=3415678 RepID=UPI003CEA4239
MLDLRMRKLEVLGPQVTPAEIEFGPRLTVIFGASNTGKTYVFDAINYMLGASSLKAIEEASGYDTAALSLMTASSPAGLTFERSIRGKGSSKFRVYDGLHRIGRAKVLSPRHQKSGNDISSLLLGEMGIENKWVRSNERNETVSLTFRLISGLFLVGETGIVSEVPAPLSGQFTSRTTERSVLRFMLQGEDDSYLPRTTKAASAERQRNEGRIAALEQIANEMRRASIDSESLAEVRRRLSMIGESIDAISDSLEMHIEEQAALNQTLRELHMSLDVRRNRANEISELLAGFALLSQKYESDLERLEMLEEAGTALGFFDVGRCVFCGAAPEHQAPFVHQAEDRTLFTEAVRTEQIKTRSLHADLQLALEDLAAEQDAVQSELSRFEAMHEEARGALLALDERLAPERGELRELIAAKGQLERKAAAYEQLAQIELLRSAVGPVQSPSAVQPRALARGISDEFGRLLYSILRAWGVPELRDVSFDADSCEISMNGVPRASHGKGMRALLHSAFTVGLAQWCIERNRPHPGFVVLDSPLVTYKEPEDSLDRLLIDSNVSGQFFHYLSSTFSGQAIVMENVAPPSTLPPDTQVYEFTKRERGRYGFFPVTPVRDLVGAGVTPA